MPEKRFAAVPARKKLAHHHDHAALFKLTPNISLDRRDDEFFQWTIRVKQ